MLPAGGLNVGVVELHAQNRHRHVLDEGYGDGQQNRNKHGSNQIPIEDGIAKPFARKLLVATLRLPMFNVFSNFLLTFG